MNADLALLSGHIQTNDNATIEALSKECGADVSFLPSILQELSEHVGTVAGNVNAAVDLTGCHRITPLLRRLTHGTLCNESMNGLTWVWSCSLVISIFAFTLLTTRAALYNSVKTRRKSKRKQKAKDDNEFEDYKEFMVEYFPDANEWTKQPVGEKKVVTLEIDIGSEIKKDPTFETQTTEPLSTDSHDDLDSPVGESRDRAFVDEDDEDSDDDSSYAYSSSDDESDEDDGDSQSALSSFLTETASLARRTIQQLRNFPPLLRGNSNRAQEYFQNSDIVLPESPYRGESQAAHSPTMSDWPTPRDSGVPLYATSRVMQVLTPLAPQKLFNFLSRTTTANEEMEPLTTPSKPSPSKIDIAPRKLSLSPLISPGPSPPKSPAIARRVSAKGFKNQIKSYKKQSSVEPSAPVEPRRVSAKGYKRQVGSYKKESQVEPSAPVEPRRVSAKGYKRQVGSYKKESQVEPSAPVEPRVSATGYRSQVQRMVQNMEKKTPSEPSPLKSRTAAKGYVNHARIHEEKATPSAPYPLRPRVPTKGYKSQGKSSDEEAGKSFVTAMIQQTVRRFTPERPRKVYK